MRAAALLIVAACSSAAAPPGVMPARATGLTAFARLAHPAVLVGGGGHVVIDMSPHAWLTVDDHGALTDDAQVAREIDRLGRAIEGDGIRVAIGRTPVVAGTDRAHAVVARPGDAAPAEAPGEVQAILPLGDGEVWQVTPDGPDQIALVDRAGHATIAPALPRLGGATCERPDAHAIAPAPDGVAALIVDCDVATDLRVETFHADGTTTVRRFAPLTTTRLAADDIMFAVLPDGRPVLAGFVGGRLAIARADAHGAWTVAPTSIAAVTFAATITVDPAGAVWTNTLGAGADGKDAYLLERDGVIVPLADPDGHPLRTHDVALDAALGVVAIGRGADGTSWLCAEHPPAGAPPALP